MTRLFGIIGDPVDHSLSPIMHAAAFEALRLDAIYAPFAIPVRSLSAALRGLHQAGIAGLNVTVPHKEAVCRLLRRSGSRLDAVAEAVGAVNTLIRTPRGYAGHNTDVIGIERSLREELRLSAAGRRVVVVGAGGAARAVAWVLSRQRPQAIWIANRTLSHAKRVASWLAKRLPRTEVRAVSLDRRALRPILKQSELLINATSLGLHAGDPLPVDPSALRRGLAVLDLVYRPGGTALVQAAKRRGSLAVDGLPMLVYQGAAAFRLWWKRPAPVAVMRRAVERGRHA